MLENALLVGLTRQMALRREMAVIANNLANVNTTGFKTENLLMEQFELPNAAGYGPDSNIKFIRPSGLNRNFVTGRIDHTDNPLDIAISGEGFFTVRMPDGEQGFTRDGHFKLDALGRLSTQAGYPVLDEGGAELIFNPEDGLITIARDGQVSTEQGERGKLGLVRFENPRGLEKAGNNVFTTDEFPAPVDEPDLLQGALESSNVQPIAQMTRMIDVMRSYSSASKLQQTGEDMQRRAIRELGNVNG